MSRAAVDSPATPQQLLAWATDGTAGERYSPLSPQPWLLFDAAAVSDHDADVIRRWLRALPCPAIGVGSTDSPLAAAGDLCVPTLDAATPLLDQIRQHPLAATVLVQVLRATETLPMTEALTVESLAYSTLQAGPEFACWLDANRSPSAFIHSDGGPAVLIDRDGDALRLELNRPSNHNGMTVEMRDALCEALQLVLADPSIQRVQLSGRGKCFSTGGDLSEFGSAPDPATAHAIRSLTLPGRLLAACADRVEVHVHGACVGSGIEFPAFAGRIIASADTWLQLPELKFGLIPGAGGCVSIARRIGRQRTAWMVLSGRRVDAQTALEWGLVDELSS